jgi:hypothetical protein
MINLCTKIAEKGNKKLSQIVTKSHSQEVRKTF